VYTKQDQERKQGIQLPVLYTLIDHHICYGVRPLGRHVMFYHLNKMLIATNHIADNNFVFQ